MRHRTLLLMILVAGSAIAAQAQMQAVIDYNPPNCIKAGEMPDFQLVLPAGQPGTLRAYFRRIGTTDWCSVDGKNFAELSSVVLPKFNEGEEIEYFFVIVEKSVVIAKSPRIYRAKAAANCGTLYARHAIVLAIDCAGPDDTPIAAAMGAGYNVKGTVRKEQLPYGSSDRPQP